MARSSQRACPRWPSSRSSRTGSVPNRVHRVRACEARLLILSSPSLSCDDDVGQLHGHGRPADRGHGLPPPGDRSVGAGPRPRAHRYRHRRVRVHALAHTPHTPGSDTWDAATDGRAKRVLGLLKLCTPTPSHRRGPPPNTAPPTLVGASTSKDGPDRPTVAVAASPAASASALAQFDAELADAAYYPSADRVDAAQVDQKVCAAGPNPHGSSPPPPPPARPRARAPALFAFHSKRRRRVRTLMSCSAGSRCRTAWTGRTQPRSSTPSRRALLLTMRMSVHKG